MPKCVCFPKRRIFGKHVYTRKLSTPVSGLFYFIHCGLNQTLFIVVVFDEDFVFEENANVIDKRTIEILLYDFDAYSRHVCIGGAQIPLNSLDLNEKVDLWTPLGSCAEQVSREMLSAAI